MALSRDGGLGPSVIINRAVPGSGKTTLSRAVVDFLLGKGLSVKIHSTDDFFMTRDGRYIFDVGMLGEYHGKNLANFSDSLREGIDIVICDNTNLTPWHTTPYSEIARENGRFILLMTFEPRELHKHVESQIVTEERPDAHGVPEEVLVRFIEEYNLYDPLLYRENAPDPDLHRSFVWDEVSCRKIASDKLCQHFDYDALFVVKPDRYHSLKGTIGQNVFDLLYGFTKNQTKGELKR